MKTQISKQHATTLGVQRPTILHTKINSGLLWQAFFMLLLVAASVVPGAAQGIYVTNYASNSGSPYPSIGEYKLDGTAINSSLVSIPGAQTWFWGLSMFGRALVVPVGYPQLIDEFDAGYGSQ